jgi:hypothetical protein
MPDRITKLCCRLLGRQGFVHKPLMSLTGDIIPRPDQDVKSRAKRKKHSRRAGQAYPLQCQAFTLSCRGKTTGAYHSTHGRAPGPKTEQPFELGASRVCWGLGNGLGLVL